MTGISAGNHIVRLTLSGYYDYEGTTYVVPGQVTNVFGTLPPLSGVAPIYQAVISAPVTSTAPAITVQPTQNSSGGIFENPAVIAGIIGIVTACIGAVQRSSRISRKRKRNENPVHLMLDGTGQPVICEKASLE